MPPENPNAPVPNIYLTYREKEVLTKVAEGKSDYEIGVLLKLTPHGVDFHMRIIYKKMQTNTLNSDEVCISLQKVQLF